MKELLPNLRSYTINSLRDFSEHPIGYTYSATKDFIKDYWDMGAMVLAGFAFNDYENKIFGEARPFITFFSGIAGIAGARQDTSRIYRNIFAGYASWLGFLDRGSDLHLDTKITNYFYTALMGSLSLYSDKERRREINANLKKQISNKSLDTFLG